LPCGHRFGRFHLRPRQLLTEELIALSVPPGAAPQRLRVRHESDGTIVLEGEIDLSTAPQLRAAIEPAATAGAVQVVDLRGVTYLDSAGLSVLYDHAAGLHLLVAPSSVVATVLDISGLSEVTTIELRAAEPAAEP
jgi:anti-sigma B factor antagonist